MATSTSPAAVTLQKPSEMPTSLPPSATFSFTAPFPPNALASSALSQPGHKQQRRVSLALPSSPRVFPAWSFRDDTSLGNVATALLPEKKGKMRKIATEDGEVLLGQPSSSTAGSSQPSMEKKQRKKWTMEETQMLVNGCNKVCSMPFLTS